MNHHICECQAGRLDAAEAVTEVALRIMKEAASLGGVSRAAIKALVEAMETYADTLPPDRLS